MQTRVRLFSFAVLSVLATAVVGVSLAWACTAPDTGIPAAGSAPPPPATTSSPAGGGAAASGSPAAAAPSASGASAATTSGSGAGSGAASSGSSSVASGSTSGAARTNRTSGAGNANRGASDNGARSGGGVSGGGGFSSTPSSQFAARVSGATAGVTSRGGQSVFASSVAPKGKAAGGARSATSPSVRGAVGDVWSGFGSSTGGSPSVSAAKGFSPGAGGGGSGIGAGVAILGLGLIGVIGTFLVAGLRRRRAESQSK